MARSRIGPRQHSVRPRRIHRDPLGAPGGLKVGIWGRARPLDTPLRERDRVEVYRPLQVDPKEARRLRYRKQGRKAKAGG